MAPRVRLEDLPIYTGGNRCTHCPPINGERQWSITCEGQCAKKRNAESRGKVYEYTTSLDERRRKAEDHLKFKRGWVASVLAAGPNATMRQLEGNVNAKRPRAESPSTAGVGLGDGTSADPDPLIGNDAWEMILINGRILSRLSNVSVVAASTARLLSAATVERGEESNDQQIQRRINDLLDEVGVLRGHMSKS